MDLLRQPSVIAHEVANHLTAVLGNLHLCRELAESSSEIDPHSQSEMLELLGFATRGIQQAAEFLCAVKTSVHDAQTATQRFDAVDVIRSCIRQEHAHALQRGVPLEEEILVGPVWLQGHAQTLHVVTANLIRNAVAASEPRSAPVRVSVHQEHDCLLLVVRDRGLGIPPENLDRVFDLGFTTGAPGEGTGIGLAVVRHISEQMFGGTVSAGSAVGQGSTFTVMLPVPPQREP